MTSVIIYWPYLPALVKMWKEIYEGLTIRKRQGSLRTIGSWLSQMPLILFKFGFPGGTGCKEPACQCRRCKRCGFNSWIRKIPWRRKWHPLQYSCLENPMDRGAWWPTGGGLSFSFCYKCFLIFLRMAS